MIAENGKTWQDAVRADAANLGPDLNLQARGLPAMPRRDLPPISRLRQLLAYDPNTGALTWLPSETMSASRNARFAGKTALTGRHQQGYMQGAVDGVRVYAHRVAWALHHGAWPVGVIDHVNHDKQDNRISNLRETTQNHNCKNQPKMRHNTSGATGVYWKKRTGRWTAMIRVDRKLRYLGYFTNFEDAVAARKAAEVQYGFHPNHGVEDAQTANVDQLLRATQTTPQASED